MKTHKRMIFIRILILIVLLVSLNGQVGNAANTPIDAIQDSGLRQAVQRHLNSDEFTIEDLRSIVSLEARGLGIKSLQGLELLFNLKSIYLTNNQIVDITPLSSLKRLSHADLEGNQIHSIEPLKLNQHLASVILNDNPLSNASMKQIIGWKNCSIPVTYTPSKQVKNSEIIVINGDRVQLEKEPIKVKQILYFDLREIAELLDIQVSFKKGSVILAKDGKVKTIDPKSPNSGVVIQSSRTYLHLPRITEWLPIQYRQDTKVHHLNYSVKDKAPLFLVSEYAGYDNKYGYMNRDGEIVIPLIYAQAYDFSDGVAAVYDGKWKVINKQRDVIADGFNRGPSKFKEGLVEIDESPSLWGNGKYGYMDIRGKMQIPSRFEYAFPFSEGLAAVQQNGKYMYVNKHGEVVIPGPYSRAFSFQNGLAAVHTSDGKFLIIDSVGRTVGRSPYAFADGIISDGLIRVVVYPVKDNYIITRHGFVNTAGKVIIPPVYSDALPFAEGKTIVRTVEGESRVLDSNGNIIGKPQKDMYGPFIAFSEGLLPMKQDGKYGYIDAKGKLVIPADFDYALPFNNGLAYVQIYDPENRPGSDQHGYIDRNGRFVYGPTNVWLADRSYEMGR